MRMKSSQKSFGSKSITLQSPIRAMTSRDAADGPWRRRMRRLSALAASMVGLAAAACSPTSDEYFREGAGTDLNSGQLAQATQLQDEYVYYICRQAGNSNEQSSAGSTCAVTDWTAFTLAGMNDIEQRCDAYLSWLDAQRRDRTPILAQIAAMGGTAGAIMGVAGVGTQALSIVATAFGLASTTYANWNSRLLLDVDHSTVQTIVYSRQQEYRKVNAGLIVPDRPAAIYLLRGYLRICMPITIETNINTSVTLIQSGVSPSAIQSMFVRKAVFDSGVVAPRSQPAPIKAKQRLTGTVAQDQGVTNARTDTEKHMSASVLSRYQSNVFCVQPTKIFDDATRDGIRIFQSSWRLPVTGEIDPDTRQQLITSDREDACPPGAMNWDELVRFFSEGKQLPENIQKLQGYLSVFLGDSQTPTGALDADTRTRIQTVREKLKSAGFVDDSPSATDEVTRAFYLKLQSEASAIKKKQQQNP
jgi:hypothetical protein